MAFTDFRSIAQVQKQYGISYKEEHFLQPKKVEPSEWLLDEFEFNRQNIDVTSSEESRCEHIIMPILKETYKQHVQAYAFWSHKRIQADETLKGVPDYMFSSRSRLGKTVLEMPILLVVEAKKNDFGLGWGQCLAELVALQKLNQEKEKPVYGVVTDGEVWHFGRLVGNEFTKETNILKLNELSEVLGTLDDLLEMSRLDYGLGGEDDKQT